MEAALEEAVIPMNLLRGLSTLRSETMRRLHTLHVGAVRLHGLLARLGIAPATSCCIKSLIA